MFLAHRASILFDTTPIDKYNGAIALTYSILQWYMYPKHHVRKKAVIASYMRCSPLITPPQTGDQH